jgi:hypothetical protein
MTGCSPKRRPRRLDVVDLDPSTNRSLESVADLVVLEDLVSRALSSKASASDPSIRRRDRNPQPGVRAVAWPFMSSLTLVAAMSVRVTK